MPDLKNKSPKKLVFTKLSHPLIFNSFLLLVFLMVAWYRKSLDPVKWSSIAPKSEDIKLLETKFGIKLPINSDEQVSYNDDRLIFDGWGKAETGHRWTIFPQASILFKVGPPKKPLKGNLLISCNGLGEQQIDVILNGVPIYKGRLIQNINSINITFDPKLILTNGDYNHLFFSIPDAHRPDNGDNRFLGISLFHFTLL